MPLTNTFTKPILLSLAVLFCSTFLKAEQLPSAAFQNYLKNNLKYPEIALTNQVGSMLYYRTQVYENGTISKFETIKNLPGAADNILLVEVDANGDQYASRATTYNKEFNELVVTTAKHYELYDKEPNGPSETVYFIVTFSIRPLPLANGDYDQTFVKLEIEPAYEGGSAAWKHYVEQHLQYPTEATKQGTEEVVVQFIVDKQGNVSEIRAISGGSEDVFRKEAERLVAQSGKWRPGIQNGHYVKAYKKQTIVFRQPK